MSVRSLVKEKMFEERNEAISFCFALSFASQRNVRALGNKRRRERDH